MDMNKVKAAQLGMPIGTASNRLRKAVLFSLVVETGKNTCFQCGEVITDSENLSIEHKSPWLHGESPVDKFFDLANVAFSHRSCNSSARRGRKDVKPCGTHAAYCRGCRCVNCRKARLEYVNR